MLCSNGEKKILPSFLRLLSVTVITGNTDKFCSISSSKQYQIASNYMPSPCLLMVYFKLKLCLPPKRYFLHKILEAER